jgi:hypothetical protein
LHQEPPIPGPVRIMGAGWHSDDGKSEPCHERPPHGSKLHRSVGSRVVGFGVRSVILFQKVRFFFESVRH